MYSEKEILYLLGNEVKNLPRDIGSYALKGGFIISNYIAKDMRMTSDIDMSVDGVNTFNKVVGSLIPLLDDLKSKGEIFKYSIKLPSVTDTRNISGGIKIYRKYNENAPARKICGLDISIHNLSFGLIVLEDGTSSFSIERMLCDKISVLYSDTKTILRRCRDLYDIFLFDKLSLSVDVKLLKECFEYRGIEIQNISTFEKMLNTNKVDLVASLDIMLIDNRRVDISLVKSEGVSTDLIFSRVLYVLDLLRGGLC